MPSPEPVHLAVCSDRNVIPGLHVTLFTALGKLPKDQPARVSWIISGVTDEEIAAMRETVRRASPHATLETTVLDAERLKGLATLQGSLLPYARLFLAELLDADRVLYLDTDLFVDLDLTPYFFSDLGGRWVGAPLPEGADLSRSLDGQYVQKTFHKPASMAYFNSGVLLFDLAEWRRRGLDAPMAEILREHGPTLISHDQTVLNVLADGDFLKMPAKLNHALTFYDGRYRDFSGTVGHFLDRPKPWDPLAGLVNPYVRLFFQTLDKTGGAGWRPKHLEIFTRQRPMLRAYARRLWWKAKSALKRSSNP